MTPERREILRLTYLQAIGIDTYVAREPLPGAAASHPLARLALTPLVSRPEPSAAVAAPEPPTPAREAPGRSAGPRRKPLVETRTARGRQPDGGEKAALPGETASAFVVAAIVVDDIVWLEELVYPALAKDQVQLLRAISGALGLEASRPDITQFTWPIHRNRQLDQSEAAACAALTGFVARQLQLAAARAVVMLGDGVGGRLDHGDLQVNYRITTVSTAQMLSEPLLKARAWADLRPLRRNR